MSHIHTGHMAADHQYHPLYLYDPSISDILQAQNPWGLTMVTIGLT